MRSYSAVAYDFKTDAWTEEKITCTHTGISSLGVGVWKDNRTGFLYRLNKKRSVAYFVRLRSEEAKRLI